MRLQERKKNQFLSCEYEKTPEDSQSKWNEIAMDMDEFQIYTYIHQCQKRRNRSLQLKKNGQASLL